MMTTRKSVLMIDDNTELVDVVRVLFEPKEFLFVSARDGAEGMFKSKNQKFDVVICDLKMPKMDGSTFIKEYRRLMKAETPILIYSGHLDGLPAELKEIKSLYRLAKPCQSYELLERVRSLSGISTPTTTTSPNAVKSTVGFEAGAYVFREGDRGTDCYMINEGIVEILKDFSDGTELFIEELRNGDILGSWAPVDGQYRFYSARAKTPILMTALTQAQINQELENYPTWMRALIKGQYHRLNTAYQSLRKTRKTN